MSLKSSISYIYNHPLNKRQKIKSITRFFLWQLYASIFKPTYIHRFTKRVNIYLKKGMTGATGNLYCGLHEFTDMAFLLHFLREEDHFMDIGANVGSYTLLASGHVGAYSHTFEPIPSTFSNLKANINLNKLEKKVYLHNCALGAKMGEVEFTSSLDTMNHIASKGQKDTIKVKVNTLDNIASNGPIPKLIKIDVEGFESEVVKGGFKTLKDNDLKAVIIELNGLGTNFGFSEKIIHETLLLNGFIPHSYKPFERKLLKMDSWGDANTIYVRDIQFVNERLNSANAFTIHNLTL